MKKIIFATSNSLKLKLAQQAASGYPVEVVRKQLETDEIQSEDPEKVARDKATKAFAILNKPVVISDDSWAFLGLNGFPGVYMHSINAWFTPEDFLRLAAPLKNREVILTQMLVYQDAGQQQVFTNKVVGKLLQEARGSSPSSPNHTVISMDGDNGLSIAEVYQQEKLNDRQPGRVWQEFFEWFAKI